MLIDAMNEEIKKIASNAKSLAQNVVGRARDHDMKQLAEAVAQLALAVETLADLAPEAPSF